MDGSLKLAVGVPSNTTLERSAANTPDKTAFPLNVAVVVPSFTLLLATKPATVIDFTSTVLTASVGK